MGKWSFADEHAIIVASIKRDELAKQAAAAESSQHLQHSQQCPPDCPE